MVARAAFSGLLVRAEAPHSVDPLHLVDDAGFLQRIERAVECNAVEVVVDHRKNFTVRERHAPFEEQFEYDPPLTRRTKPGAAQNLLNVVQADSPLKSIYKPSQLLYFLNGNNAIALQTKFCYAQQLFIYYPAYNSFYFIFLTASRSNKFIVLRGVELLKYVVCEADRRLG